jgi:nucleoside-specific outer membrane channel protein Tsx
LAKGAPISAILDEILEFMQYLEDNIIDYYRYVDDILFIYNEDCTNIDNYKIIQLHTPKYPIHHGKTD